MKRTLITMMGVAAVFLVAAGTLSAQLVRARVWPPGFKAQVALDTMESPREISAPYGKVFLAAVAAFDELKIPLDQRDSIHGVVGNLAIRKVGSFAGSQLSRWFNCGIGITGANADNFRISLAVALILDPVQGSDKTLLRAGAVAGAEDRQGSMKEAVACGSTGGLEAKLVELVRKKAGVP